MKKSKKIICLCLIAAIAIIGGIFLIRNISVESNKNQNTRQEEKPQSGTFEYVPSFGNASVEEVYYYSDDYFVRSGKEQNEHLRTMSMCLALASTTSVDKENKDENIKNLLVDTGFENIVIDDIDKEPTKDTIGSAIASKEVEGKKLIVVSIRGSNYLYEWASNFTVGKKGDLEGFSRAAQIIIDRIKVYQEEYEIADCKLWITGYSRGGSVANLAGKYINENLAELRTSEDDLYVYTFEAPLSSTSKVTFENIHNVVNPNDMITYVYPAKWGLRNNGIEEQVGEKDKRIVQKEWKLLNGELIDCLDKDGNVKMISSSQFLEDFINWITKKNRLVDYALSREKYCYYLESAMNDLIELYYSKTKEERQEILVFFQTVLTEFLTGENLNDIKEQFSDFPNMNFDTKELLNMAKEYMDLAFEASDIALSKEELEIIENSIISASEAIVPIIIVSVFDGSTTLNFDMQMTGFYHFATLVNSFPELVKEHYTQTNLKLVQAEDSYYQ